MKTKAKARKNQAGFTALLTMLFAVLVFMILMSMAIPQAVQTYRDVQFSLAKQNVRTMGNVITTVLVCQQTTGCTPNPALLALIPVNGNSVVQGGYTYTMSSAAGWTTYTYSAAPIGTSEMNGMAWIQTTQAGVMTCRWGPSGSWLPC